MIHFYTNRCHTRSLFCRGSSAAQECKPRSVINAHALAWQEGNIAYYRKQMMRFMELQRLEAEAGTLTPQKQAMRRHMISDLHNACVVCLDKINQLQGGTDANT